jgi:basic membrane lipoprotein Med (substrate-binding protein (PBP1-ABC) superfamily)
MKRIAIVLVALALAVTACGGDNEPSETTVTPGTETTAATAETTAAPDTATTATTAETGIRVALVTPGEINDLSWNQVMYEGAEALKAEGLISDFSYTELVPEGDAERAIRGYAEDGYDLIVAHSFGYGETALAVAADFPDTAFAWAGGIEGQTGNLADYAQPFYEAYYLAGILAGGVTKTDVLGGAGGFDIPVCHSLIEAFYLGAQEVNPAVRGVTAYVGDWIDVVKAKEAASAAAADGADVFAACGEGPVLGQIELAKEQGLYAIGYVGDMSSLAPASVLASVTWNTKELLRPMIEDVMAGTFTPAKYYSVGVADDGLIVKINPELEGDISQAAMDLYTQRLQEIKDGTFTVPFITE